jgi:hypothetical protein
MLLRGSFFQDTEHDTPHKEVFFAKKAKMNSYAAH